MYLRLANATFLTNLGPMSNLTNAWSVQYSTSGNITKNTGSFSVTKGGTLTATYTLGSGAEFTSATISPTDAGTVSHSVSGSTVTVTVANVSANFTLSVVASGSAPVTPTNYTFTINPDPTSATVTLSATGYSTVSGTGSKSISVADGTKVNWSVSASGYTTRSGNWTISGGNKTESVVLSATSGDETGVSFSDDDFEIGAWTTAGAPVELDSRFRTKTTKRFNRDVTFKAVTLPNTSGPTSLRFISNGTQTNWINDSYTVPANTEFHLILARAGQSGAVDITKSITVPEGATKLYVNSLKDQKANAFAIVNGVTYSGSDFVDKLYHYGEKGAAMSILTNSSKAASHQDPIAVTAGETVTIRTFTNGTLGYVFVDDADTIIAIGASTEFMSEYFTPTRYFTYE